MYIIGINLAICLVFIIKGILIKYSTRSFKLFLFYDLLLAIMLLAQLLNTLQLASGNPLLNLVSLIYFVACIAIPPTMYGYVKALNFDFSEHKNLLLPFSHFVPAIILLIINLFSFVYFNVAQSAHVGYVYVENIMNYANVLALYFVFLIQIVFYAVFLIKEYHNYRKKISDLYSFEDGVDFKWVQIFIGGFIAVIVLVYAIQLIGSVAKIIFNYIMLGYIVIINYSAVKQLNLYQKITSYIAKPIVNPIVIEDAIINQETLLALPQHLNATISETLPKDVEVASPNDPENIPNIDSEMLANLQQSIKDAMERDKLFLDSDLSLGKLAALLNTNTKYVSYCINTCFDKNFSTFVNEYRIHEAIRLIDTDTIQQYTLEAIAEQSGFKSRSVFITAFKKVTGKTPSQFKKDI